MPYHIREKSLQVDPVYHLKDRSSEDLLLFTEGSKWYLGRLSEWSTYAAEQNLAGKEVVRTVLDKIFDCENERGIAQIRMISHQPLGGKTVKDYSKNDDASKEAIWKLLTEENGFPCKWGGGGAIIYPGRKLCSVLK